MKRITEMMSDVDMLEDKEKKELEKLTAERESLEEEAETELLVNCSEDIYGDGDQSPLKG